MQNNLVLFSGGLDSTVCLELMKKSYNVIGVGFDYNQPHKIELGYATVYSNKRDIEYCVYDLPYIPKKDDIIFCGRNAILLSMAFSIAESRNIKHVTIGVNSGDNNVFPDCRKGFIDSMATIGMCYGVTLHAPLLNCSKRDIIKISKDLNIDINETWTCYSPRFNGTPCGKCYSCIGLDNAKN